MRLLGARRRGRSSDSVKAEAAGQNRDQHDDFRAHLQGRIAFVRSVNPQ